jgi:6-phosphogluconolactonase (cycloisomerase 2 family)
LAAGINSPSYLARSADRLFAVGEADGTVSEFSVSGDDLHFLGTQPVAGTFPCSIGVLDDGAAIGVACYGDGVIDVHPVIDGGMLAKTSQSLRGEGSSIRPQQEGPHAHDVLQVDATTVLTTDLGTDHVYIHTLADGTLTRTGSVAVPAGSGPRDLVLHPSGAVWVLAELSGELIVLEPSAEGYELAGSVPLPGAEEGDHASAVAPSADGRFVYVGLRGSNRISLLTSSTDGRRFEPIGYVDCGGAWPRHLVVDGEFLRVANQLSNSVATFLLGDDGIPQPHSSLSVPSPTYLLLD